MDTHKILEPNIQNDDDIAINNDGVPSNDASEPYIVDVDDNDDDDYDKIFNSDDDEDDSELKQKIKEEDIIQIDDFQSNQMVLIQKVAKPFNLPYDVAYLLLKKFKWKENSMNDYYFENQLDNSENLSKLLNIPISKINGPLTGQIIGKGPCPICDNKDCDLFQLYCGHNLCCNCLKLEIQTQIKQQHFPVLCRIDHCNSEIMIQDIELFCEKEVFQTYKQNFYEKQMFLDENLIKCPKPDCPFYFNKKAFNLCYVGQCSCGKRICLRCQQDAHAPLRCEQIQEWQEKNEKMDKHMTDQINCENFEYPLKKYRRTHKNEIDNINTDKKDSSPPNESNNKKELYVKLPMKNCPFCKTLITKDGGCNSVQCKVCGKKFCWICLKDWNTNGHRSYYCPFEQESIDSINKSDENINNNNDNNNNDNNNNDNNNNDNNNNDNNNNDKVDELVVFAPVENRKIRRRRRRNNIRDQINDEIRVAIEKDDLEVSSFIVNDNLHDDYYYEYEESESESHEDANKNQRQSNYYEDNGNNKDVEDNDDSENDEEDCESTLHPMNEKTNSQFDHWFYCKKKYLYYLNILETQNKAFGEDDQQSVKNLFEAARSILMHGYQLLALLEPGTISYHKYELYLEALERRYNYLLNKPNKFDHINDINKDIHNIMEIANSINFPFN